MILLTGLRGENLLAYLAALGLLRTASRMTNEVKLSWRDETSVYHPTLHIPLDAEEVLDRLTELLQQPPPLEGLDQNLKMSNDDYRGYARSQPEWAAGLGCETDEDVIRKTGWILIGAAKQTIVPTLCTLAAKTTRDKLERALFRQWDYKDEGLSLRLDPADQKDYALRWNDPSPEGASTMHGACRLAVEALPIFPVLPAPRPTTVGIASRAASWPIWSDPLPLDVVCSLLNSPEIQGEVDRESLARRGIVEVYRSRKQSVGKYTSFAIAAPA